MDWPLFFCNFGYFYTFCVMKMDSLVQNQAGNNAFWQWYNRGKIGILEHQIWRAHVYLDYYFNMKITVSCWVHYFASSWKNSVKSIYVVDMNDVEYATVEMSWTADVECQRGDGHVWHVGNVWLSLVAMAFTNETMPVVCGNEKL